jgi:hypothetical protein
MPRLPVFRSGGPSENSRGDQRGQGPSPGGHHVPGDRDPVRAGMHDGETGEAAWSSMSALV